MDWLRRPGMMVWTATSLVMTAVLCITLVGPPSAVIWTSPMALFVTITIAASLCAVAALAVIAAAHRRDLAEVGFLGTGLYAVSALPLVHGLTAPGVLYGPNSAVMVSALLALPAMVYAALPLIVPQHAFARWCARRWRVWSGLWVVSTTLAAIGMLRFPNALAFPGRTHPVTIVLAAVGLGGAVAFSLRQLRLYGVSGHRAHMCAALGFTFIGLTSLVWIGEQAFSVGWWFVHALDVAGVFTAAFALLAQRVRRTVLDVLQPILSNDPLVAFELGLEPVVHEFVARLDRKDAITRDHVVRTAERAMEVGAALGLGSRRLRFLGLAALLHDIGKVHTPDEILNKPGRLTPDEFEVMKRHVVDGDDMVRRVASLAPAAPFIRGHHERVDGAGYPDGLRADDIPLESRIIAACDAFDAMAHSRQYREGMGEDRAIAVLREHASAQWDATVVNAVIARVLRRRAGGSTESALMGVGRSARHAGAAGARACECADALPPEAAAAMREGDLAGVG